MSGEFDKFRPRKGVVKYSDIVYLTYPGYRSATILVSRSSRIIDKDVINFAHW